MDNALKYKLIEKIIQIEDDKVLNKIKSILGLSEIDFWDELPKEVKQSIEKAKAELDRGESITHEEVVAEVRKKYLKE